MDNGNNTVESHLHEHDVGETGKLLVKRDILYILKCINGIMLAESQLVLPVRIFTDEF